MTRRCDAIIEHAGGDTSRCESSSIGLFEVNGSRMRLCGRCEDTMETKYTVRAVTRWCVDCSREPCVCNVRRIAP